MENANFSTLASFLRFVLAGNARVTLVSQKTGTRFTYRVRASNDGRVFFVSVLTGQDNESDFEFVGTIFADRKFKPSLKSRIGADAPSVKGFSWFWGVVAAGRLPETCSVHHEGRCGRCGRALTVPESIETGLGPECSKAA